MPKIIAILVILFLSLSASPGYCFTSINTHVEGGKNRAASSGVRGQDVVNILLDKIEGGFVYSTDGRRFEMTPRTKIMTNRGGSKVRSAELHFIQGKLVNVYIK